MVRPQGLFPNFQPPLLHLPGLGIIAALFQQKAALLEALGHVGMVGWKSPLADGERAIQAQPGCRDIVRPAQDIAQVHQAHGEAGIVRTVDLFGDFLCPLREPA
ncbi:MAG: hypothetical protein L0170_15190 [Acidobacteria bacterium]|nr:hypothetical protein [Acidobacteriota bacterium]